MVGCEFTVKFANTGYSAVELIINWLSQSAYQINRLEANDSKIMFNLASAIVANPGMERLKCRPNKLS